MMKQVVAAGLALVAAAGLAAPRGGIFIPRNGSYEGWIGASHVLFDTTAGGVFTVVTGEWPRLTTLGRFGMVFSAQGKDDPAPVEVRQEYDRAPEVNFLEEGNDRIGLRVKFRLFDNIGRYFGHGMVETWQYRNGELFVTAAATFENAQAKPKVLEARLEGAMPAWYSPLEGKITQDETLENPLTDAALPGRLLHFKQRIPDNIRFIRAPDVLPDLSLYWRTGRMEHNTFIFRNAGEVPYYYRWPDYFRQAYGMGAYLQSVKFADGTLQLRWPTAGQTSFNGLFRLAPGDAKPLVEAERAPVKLGVAGGVIHGNLEGYNDQEGAYEVRKTADPLTITLPADPLKRNLRLKIVSINTPGAVTAVLDGKALVPQLSSEGGIADDPLAPIREQPEACADTAVLTVNLTDQPQTLVIRETEGVQYTYMSRDTMRHVAVFTTKGGWRHAGLRFSLVDGHARNMRQHGRTDWALSENLLTWFSYCGYTPDQVLFQLRDFEVLKNGPDEAIFRYVSANSSDAAQSEYIVRVPANAPGMRMDVTATFTVLGEWPYTGNQFFDVFPFRGVQPRDWWYRETLMMAPDGRWKSRQTVKGIEEGDTKLSEFAGGGFFAMYASDRGNMVMLVKDPKPELPVDHVICGNYIDYHMTIKYPEMPKAGFTNSIRYELALWGDGKTTRDQLLDLGRRSIQAGTLAVK